MPARRALPATLLALLLVALCAPPQAPAALIPGRDFAPGQLIVRFQKGAGLRVQHNVLRKHKLRIARNLHIKGVALVNVPAGRDLNATLNELRRDRKVRNAQLNYIFGQTSLDPGFAQQYALSNQGQPILNKAGVVHADISAEQAWGITHGSKSVVIAVVDTGVAYDNPDLASNIWVNPGETGTDSHGRDKRSNGVDDDHNGYVDDWHGWNVSGPSMTDPRDSNNDPRDTRGHGTTVASIIGATPDNNIGTAGVDWQVSIMPVRVQGARSQMTAADVAEGFEYAADNGAKIVNASLAGPYASVAMEQAIANHKETLFVVAADNGNKDLDNPSANAYPCEFHEHNIVCVEATDNRDRLASYSNESDHSVDLAAPGTAIFADQPAFQDVFTEEFEKNDLARNWTTGSLAGGPPSTWGTTTDFHHNGLAVTDSPNGPPAANQTSWIQKTQPIDLTQQAGCQLRWYTAFDTDGAFFVQARNDTNFTLPPNASSLDSLEYDAGQFGPKFKGNDISDLSGKPLFLRFGLVSGPNGNVHAGAYLDAVRVSCLGGSYSADGMQETSYESGTSMSSAFVSGVAGLIAARYPHAPVGEIRRRLLDGADRLPQLFGASVTGGRLNAFKSLTLPPSR